MALAGNVRRAWDFLLTMFEYQDELGGIPDHISDRNQMTWISTKPPLFGFAVVYILENYDVSGLAIEDYEELYNKLARYTKWWFTHHDHSHSGIPPITIRTSPVMTSLRFLKRAYPSTLRTWRPM
jgi:hypothetical protein